MVLLLSQPCYLPCLGWLEGICTRKCLQQMEKDHLMSSPLRAAGAWPCLQPGLLQDTLYELTSAVMDSWTVQQYLSNMGQPYSSTPLLCSCRDSVGLIVS